MVMRNFRQLFQFLAIPVAMTGFVLLASYAGGFVMRKEPVAKIDSSLASQAKNPRG
jgi:hypothetical protein